MVHSLPRHRSCGVGAASKRGGATIPATSARSALAVSSKLPTAVEVPRVFWLSRRLLVSPLLRAALSQDTRLSNPALPAPQLGTGRGRAATYAKYTINSSPGTKSRSKPLQETKEPYDCGPASLSVLSGKSVSELCVQAHLYHWCFTSCSFFRRSC